MKKTTLIIALAVLAVSAFAQKKTTTSATVKFDAATPLDALPVAENKTVVAAIDTKKGTVAFEAVVKSFNFSNPMMQEHFNGERWFNSEKFPKTTFTGKITNLSAINFSKNGTYEAKIEGELTMKGITKPLSTTATITVNGDVLITASEFTIALADYDISDAKGKIAKEPKIFVSAELK
ncbi:MAG TPA: YceI family protein [Ferruginibacter sp.]|nr:YceI family protein [Ferruginibacter sp.]HMP21875.1 YceI family protein [Ferruginibacter sp.]